MEKLMFIHTKCKLAINKMRWGNKFNELIAIRRIEMRLGMMFSTILLLMYEAIVMRVDIK